MIRQVCLVAGALLATTGLAQAGTVQLKDLLSQGFTIAGTAVAPASVTSNALATPNQPDELVVTLQRAGDIAFCHFYFSATYSNETIPEAACFQPGFVAPPAQSAPPSQAPAGEPSAASSSELPMSTASSAQ